MSSDQLAEYVSGLLRQGYPEEGIRRSLAEHGYPQSLVEAAFRTLKTRTPQEEAPSDLGSYVNRLRGQGYTDAQLRAYLAQQGYDDASVERALGVVRHEHHLPNVTLAKLFLLVVFVGVTAFAITLLSGEDAPGPGTQLLDLTASVTPSTATAGSQVTVRAEAVNMGTAARYDVTLRTELADGRGTLILSEEETRALSTSVATATTITLPRDLAPGRYEVRVRASYDGRPATATAALTVRDRETTAPVEDEPDTPTTTTPPPIVIVSGGSGGEELQEQATIAAKRGDGGRAERLCTEIANQVRRDDCLKTITVMDKDAGHCDAITGDEERDTCLMPFILDGDYRYCTRLVAQERRDLCENLQHLSGLSAAPAAPGGPSINDAATPS